MTTRRKPLADHTYLCPESGAILDCVARSVDPDWALYRCACSCCAPGSGWGKHWERRGTDFLVWPPGEGDRT